MLREQQQQGLDQQLDVTKDPARTPFSTTPPSEIMSSTHTEFGFVYTG